VPEARLTQALSLWLSLSPALSRSLSLSLWCRLCRRNLRRHGNGVQAVRTPHLHCSMVVKKKPFDSRRGSGHPCMILRACFSRAAGVQPVWSVVSVSALTANWR
jgi:hypothetical protein